MGRFALFSLVLLALLLPSCGQTLQGSPQTGLPAENNFSLVFKYGVGARNVLDTAQGTYTKDMIEDPPITIELKLTRDDLDRILAKMNDIDFWSYPKVLEYEVPADGLALMVTPYSSYDFKVQRGTTVTEVATKIPSQRGVFRVRPCSPGVRCG